MTLELSNETEVKMGIAYKKIIEEAVDAALDIEGCPYEVEISVTITDNKGIRRINKEFRGIDKATDVLSFPLCEYKKPGKFTGFERKDDLWNPESGELMLGDIVISAEKVISQAAEYGHSKKRELAFLVVHSMLHLMGYDHMIEKDRKLMEERQRVILESRGITR